MKYELGDYVRINKRWKKTKDYLNEDEIKFDETKDIVIRKKVDCRENGFIAGYRYKLLQFKELIKIVDDGAEMIEINDQ